MELLEKRSGPTNPQAAQTEGGVPPSEVENFTSHKGLSWEKVCLWQSIFP